MAKSKPVAFVSYGGVSGGLRAVEQLRLVFAELHAVTMRDAVSFAGAWEQFDQSGKLLQPERAKQVHGNHAGAFYTGGQLPCAAPEAKYPHSTAGLGVARSAYRSAKLRSTQRRTVGNSALQETFE